MGKIVAEIDVRERLLVEAKPAVFQHPPWTLTKIYRANKNFTKAVKSEKKRQGEEEKERKEKRKQGKVERLS